MLLKGTCNMKFQNVYIYKYFVMYIVYFVYKKKWEKLFIKAISSKEKCLFQVPGTWYLIDSDEFFMFQKTIKFKKLFLVP